MNTKLGMITRFVYCDDDDHFLFISIISCCVVDYDGQCRPTTIFVWLFFRELLESRLLTPAGRLSVMVWRTHVLYDMQLQNNGKGWRPLCMTWIFIAKIIIITIFLDVSWLHNIVFEKMWAFRNVFVILIHDLTSYKISFQLNEQDCESSIKLY